MTTEPDEKVARALGQLLIAEADPRAEGATSWQQVGERRLLQAMRGAPQRPSRLQPQWVGATIGVCALVAAFVLWSRQPGGARDLGFVVRGADPSGSEESAAVRTRVVGGQAEATSIDFSDGTRLAVHAQSSARLQEVDSHGATVVLERGGLDAEVVPAPGASWSVLAGPYEVRVLGTRFTTFWDPEEQAFSVRLQRGSVRILGTDIQEAVELRPGQRFDARAGGWSVTALDAEGQRPGGASAERSDVVEATAGSTAGSTGDGVAPVAPLLSAPAASAPPEGGAEAKAHRRGSGSVSSPTKGPGPSWTELVNRGRSEEVLALAEKRGVGQCLESCSSDELRALADAARYTGRGTVARDALLALRARGPGESARAGYFLGSLSESRGQAAGALEWYGRCLQEAPDGPFSAEARAGRMRALVALGQRTEARRQAREYLRLHPDGVAAERARQLLSRP